MSFPRSIGFTVGAVLLAIAIAPQANAAPPIKTLNAPGCKWIGTRVVQSLVRDDIIAANEYNDMYKTMACPAKDLILAFSCTVKGISPPEDSQTTNQPTAKAPAAETPEDYKPSITDGMPRVDKAKASKQIIDACWDDPR